MALIDLGKLVSTPADLLKLQDALAFVGDRRDDLVLAAKFATELPALLRALSSGLEDAGTQARLAAGALSGASGATGRLGSSAQAVAGISGNLGSAAGVIGNVSAEVGKVPLMGLPAKQLSGAALTIESTIAGLDSLAEDLSGLADLMAVVGSAIDTLGVSLQVTGKAAQKITG